MPIIRSAKKQNKQNKVNKSRNDHFKALYRESRKAFEAAIKTGELKAAQDIYTNTKTDKGENKKSGLQSNIDKLAKKNIIHPNNAARKKAKFVRMMKALEQK